MRPKFRILIAITLLALVGLSCNLSKVSSQAATAAAAPATAAPTAVQPGDSTSAATATPAGLAGVRLELSDLPSGFREASDAELQQMGISYRTFADGISANMSNVTTENYAAFLDPTSNEVVVSVVVGSLTTLEKIAFDVFLHDSTRVINSIAPNAPNTTLTEHPTDTIGDSSLVLDTLTQGSYASIAGQTVISRRGSVVQLALTFYPNGGSPVIDAASVAQIMDTKIQSVQ